MSQQGFSRYWLVVGLFLSINAAGLVWIRYAWDPHRAPRLVMLDVTPRSSEAPQAAVPDGDDDAFVSPAAIKVPAEPAKGRVIEPARIVAWLPIADATSALTPDNVVPDEKTIGAAKNPQAFEAAERLLAVFDRPVVTDADLNRPLEHAPFHISPQAAGHWRWTSTNRLAFVLDKPLPPGRRYELTAAVDFTETTKAELEPASRQFRFETSPLMCLFTRLRNCTREQVTFEIVFNQAVAPADLQRSLFLADASTPFYDPFVREREVRTENRVSDIDNPFVNEPEKVPAAIGASFPATVLTREPDSKLVVTTRRPDAALRVILSPKLTGHGGSLPLGLTQDRAIALPRTFSYVRSGVATDSFSDRATVRLYFSNGLSADQEKPKLKITPPVEDFHLEFSPGGSGDETYHAGMALHGKFECGRRYTLTLPSTLLAIDGQTLGETSPITFDTPHRPSDLQIAAGQGILIPDGNLMLDMKCVNIDGVRMSGSRLHANNLTAFLQGRNDTATMRSIVLERHRSLDLKKDVPQTVGLDLRQLLQSEGNAKSAPLLGVYRITVADSGEYWNRETATVAITDLGLTAKRGRDGWLVWVLSLRSAQPQAGVTVTARSYNNQVLAQAATDASGLAALSIPDNHPDGKAWLLTAERDGDLNYLQPDRHSWMVDSVDQSGRDWPDHYEAMLYAERGVHRPGETVHLTGILRDRQGHRPPVFPVTVRVTRPDGRVIANLPCDVKPDRQGMFQIDYPSSLTGQTGTYRFDVTIPGAKESLGGTSTQIEAFVPIRIATEASPAKPRFVTEPAVLGVAAKYLFGQPAAGLDVTATGTWQRIGFQSPEYKEYHFGDFNGRNTLQVAEARGKLNDAGTLELPLAAPQDDRPGVWSASVNAAVTETGGRSVSAACRVEVDTVGVHIGVKPPEKRVVVVDEVTTMPWVLLTGEARPANVRPVRMTLARVDYDTTVVQVNGRPVWRTVERLIEVESRSLEPAAQDSTGSIDVKCPAPGRYRLRLIEPESRSATQLEFYAATHRSDRIDVPLQQPEQLDIVLDQNRYRPGQTARALIRAPFPGQVLLTVEGDRVYDRRVVSLEENSQLIEVPIPAEVRGGAYVTATVIRSIDPQRADWLPHRAYGLARLVMDPASAELPVTLETAATALPGSNLKVLARVDVPELAAAQDGNSAAQAKRSLPLVHLWAVDEGILMTTRYATPRPLDFFHKPRRLGVSSADSYGELLPDYLRPAGMTRIGADRPDGTDAEVDAPRRNPVEAPRRLPAVVWQTVQPVGDDGTLSVDLTLPEMTGALRLMAVAVHDDKYGSTDRRVTVTSPLLVESTWPRCAAPQDSFKVPVKLFNTTGAPIEAEARIVASGPVAVQWAGDEHAQPVARVTIEPGKPLLRWLNVSGRGIGPATVRIEATATATDGQSLAAFSEGVLAIRSAAPLHSETTVIRHVVGTPLKLEPPLEFQEGSTRVSIAVNALPSADLSTAIDSLIDYPHGCGEQTSSRLYALIAAQRWMNAGLQARETSQQRLIADLIEAGVVRLWSMQNRNGGIGYWQGGESSPWVSAYAAGALIAARDGGADVDSQLISDMAKYLESVLDGPAGHEVSDNLRANLCRILAEVDKPKQGWMSLLSDRVDSLDAEGRAHLAASWIRIGRKDRAATVLPEATFRLQAAPAASGRITSAIRQDAVLLQTLLDLDPSHAAIPSLVERIQSARKKQVWMNTLENATAVSALARYRSTLTANNDFTGTVERDGKPLVFSHTSPLQDRWTGGFEPLTIASQGQGEFYVVRTVEGLHKTVKVTPYDRQLKVRREWLDRQGRPVDPSKLRVGDLVRVSIQISTPESGLIENVAIVDALPGGVEIENPRLATSDAAVQGGLSRADHTEFLDDRAVLFTSVRGVTQVFEYSVRVTTPGRFEWPPIQASSMYDPSFASVHGGGTVVVHGRDEVIGDVAERPDENATNRD